MYSKTLYCNSRTKQFAFFNATHSDCTGLHIYFYLNSILHPYLHLSIHPKSLDY